MERQEGLAMATRVTKSWSLKNCWTVQGGGHDAVDHATEIATMQLAQAKAEWKVEQNEALVDADSTARETREQLHTAHSEATAEAQQEAEEALQTTTAQLMQEQRLSLETQKAEAEAILAQLKAASTEAQQALGEQLAQSRNDLDSMVLQGFIDQRMTACRVVFAMLTRLELRTQATVFIHWKLGCTMDRLKLQACAAISQVELDKDALLEQKKQGEQSADAALNATQQ
jgi:hypothetical protein